MSLLQAASRAVVRPMALLLAAGPLLVGCGADAPPATDADPVATRPDGVALCYSALAETHPATLAFRQALGDGDREARAAAIEALEAAAAEHPAEEELALFLGLANLWRVAEPLDSDQAGFITSALAAKSELARAYELCPSDYRIAAWLGPVLVNMGRALGDQATIDEGLTVLDDGIAHYPGFVLFSKLLGYADLPADDPAYQNALDAGRDNVGYCVDDSGALTPDPACRNSAAAFHNVEGASVFLGDVLAKAGLGDEARAAYEGAHTSGDYLAWDWQALLDDRLATLDDRMKSYANGDPADDAESAWAAPYQCAVCHTR